MQFESTSSSEKAKAGSSGTKASQKHMPQLGLMLKGDRGETLATGLGHQDILFGCSAWTHTHT